MINIDKIEISGERVLVEAEVIVADKVKKIGNILIPDSVATGIDGEIPLKGKIVNSKMEGYPVGKIAYYSKHVGNAININDKAHILLRVPHDIYFTE